MSAGKLQALHKKWLKSNASEDTEAQSDEDEEDESETDEQDASVEEEDEDEDADAPLVAQGVPSRSSAEAAAANAAKDELDFELLPAAIVPAKASPLSVKAAGGPKPLGKKSNSKGLSQGEAEPSVKKEEKVQPASADEDQREARVKSKKKSKKRSRASPTRDDDPGAQHAQEPPNKKAKLKLAIGG